MTISTLVTPLKARLKEIVGDRVLREQVGNGKKHEPYLCGSGRKLGKWRNGQRHGTGASLV